MTAVSKFLRLSIGSPVLRQFDSDDIGVDPGTPHSTVGAMRLPSEPIGTVAIAVIGVKDGSEVHVYNASGARLTGTEATAGGEYSFQLPMYVAGSASNTVRVFIASLGYENIDLTYTLTGVNASIPVFQRIDRNYRNPT